MKISKILPLIPLVLAQFLQADNPTYAERLQNINLSDGNLAIEGYDPVSYFDGEATKGNPSLTHEYEGIRYHFSSPENLERFKSKPARYEPQYGGWCAWAMLDAEKVKINPKAYKIIDDKLYLFYDGFYGDTLKRWNKKAAKEPEADLVSKADEGWKKVGTGKG